MDSYSFFFKFLRAKAMVQNNKAAQRENAALTAENMSLLQAILKKSCFTCGDTTVPAELPARSRRLLMENGRLKGEYTHHTHTEHCTHTFHTRAPTHVQM
jgi:homeobox-leucine zipper protein